MTGAEFAAAGLVSAQAYARLRPGGTAWLAVWTADDPAAADELAEWELEGCPWSGWPSLTKHGATDMTTNCGSSPVSVPAVIEAVQALIADPSRWCPGAEARDAADEPVDATDPNAVAWSIAGAIERVIDPEADDIDGAEWQRRTELEIATYHALGISTEPADGGLVRHEATMAVLRAVD